MAQQELHVVEPSSLGDLHVGLIGKSMEMHEHALGDLTQDTLAEMEGLHRQMGLMFEACRKSPDLQ